MLPIVRSMSKWGVLIAAAGPGVYQLAPPESVTDHFVVQRTDHAFLAAASASHRHDCKARDPQRPWGNALANEWLSKSSTWPLRPPHSECGSEIHECLSDFNEMHSYLPECHSVRPRASGMPLRATDRNKRQLYQYA
jgi:hypothetical protein